MRYFLLLLLLCSSCTVAVAPPTPTSVPSPTVAPSPMPFPQASPPVEALGRYNFLLLGGDYREHRAGTKYGDKTDVILLVSILMDTPTKITVVQFPRNLYVPVEAMDDQWLFHVYGREGFPGLHYYFQQVFDVDLHGIFYINMDNFVYLIDSLGGLWVENKGLLMGEGTLAYLRDNDNNWGLGAYDAEGRQFKVLYALAEKIKTRFRENGLVTAKDLWGAYGGLVKTDLTDFEQIHYLAELAWTIATKKYTVEHVRLGIPTVLRGETPLEVRGLVPADNLAHWITEVLDG